MTDAGADRPGIVIPTYKEADTIARLLAGVRAVWPVAPIVVVDDSPDDGTAAAVRGSGLTGVEILSRTGKGGRGTAVLDGMRMLLAQGAAPIVEMDADYSHDPAVLPLMLDAYSARKLDLVIGSRYLPGARTENWPLRRRLFSNAANLVVRAVLRLPARDCTGGYRLYSRRAAEVVTEHCGRAATGFMMLSEMQLQIHLRGMAIGEVPLVFRHRTRKDASVTPSEIGNALRGLRRLVALRRRLRRELRKS